MPDYGDGWELDSGFRDDYDLTITSAHFAPDAAYNDGNSLLLHLIGTDEDGAPVEEKLSVGGDWDTTDGGRSIVHPKKTKVNKRSKYGEWITGATELPDLMAAIKDRGTSLDASVWEGITVHVKTENRDYGPNINDGKPVSVRIPTAFLGLTGSDTPATVNSTSTKPTAAELLAQRKATTSSSSPIMDSLLDLARQANSHEEFVDLVLANHDEVLADEELAGQVVDPEGIYAQAKG